MNDKYLSKRTQRGPGVFEGMMALRAVIMQMRAAVFRWKMFIVSEKQISKIMPCSTKWKDPP